MAHSQTNHRSYRLVAVVAAMFVASVNAGASAQNESNAAVDEARSTAIKTLNDLRAEMKRARAADDWQAYLVAAKRQSGFLNGSPLSRLEIARAQARTGDLNSALNELWVFARMGQASEVLATLPDFASLRGTPQYAAIRFDMTVNGRPVALSAPSFRMNDRTLLAEDIDYDPAGQRFLISSVLMNKIVAVTPQGAHSDFAVAPDGWPILAVKIDRRRNLVWASEVALDGFASIDKAAYGRSAILCYDLRTKKLLRRLEAPRPSSLGDIALLADGTPIVSDGEHGGIYQVKRDDDRLERLDAGDFISPQTVAAASDDGHLLVPDYVRGLGSLDLKTKKVIWFDMQGRYALNGIDGLYRVGDELIAVQNGTSPERVVIFSLDRPGTRIVSERVIERSTPTLGDPTHGVVVGDDFYYIANSGWDVLDPTGKVKPGSTLTEPVIMKIALQPKKNGKIADSSRNN